MTTTHRSNGSPVLALAVPALSALGSLTFSQSTCRTDSRSAASAASAASAGSARIAGLDGLGAVARSVLEKSDPDPEIEALREAGPQGLEALLELRDSISSASTVARLDAAIDRVAAQRYASVSRLYWYTDLDRAKAAAKRLHRPILSLRMLGRLTDELSCANSRFFRTVLYPHPGVREMLARDFVLHWSSEREAPVITIDFGDGRKLVQTITGNSIHYVLDEDGFVADAIPGLYSPDAFLERLAWAKGQVSATPDLRAMAHLGEARKMPASASAVPSGRGRTTVPASEAVRIAVSKSVIEAPKLGARLEALPVPNGAGPVVELAEATVHLMKLQNPGLTRAQLDDMIVKLKKSIAADTARNESVLHRRIHEKLASSTPMTIETLNPWVYAELFATPAQDPWLGLHDPTAFTGLEGAGIRSN